MGNQEPITQDKEMLDLIGRRLIVGSFQQWRMAVLDPVYGRVEPAIGDYLKYIRSYLFFYSDGSPRKRRSIHSAFGFGSRLLHVLKRLFTNSIKPEQLFPDSFTEKEMTPRASMRNDTACVPPQSGQTSCDN